MKALRAAACVVPVLAAGLVATSADAAILFIHAVGTASGVDGDGVLGLPGATYDQTPFDLTATIDTSTAERLFQNHGAVDRYTDGFATSGSPRITTGGLKADPQFNLWEVETHQFANASTVFVVRWDNFLFGPQRSIQINAEVNGLLNSPFRLLGTDLCAKAILCGGGVSGIGSSTVVDIRLNSFIVGGAAPEPASWALMILGFGLAGAGLRTAGAASAAPRAAPG